jgi:hypothetical protein
VVCYHVSSGVFVYQVDFRLDGTKALAIHPCMRFA